MEYSAETRLPLHSIGIIYPSPSLHTTLQIGIIFTHTYMNHWGESKRALKRLRFWRLMPKGERILAQSKRTTLPPLKFKKMSFSIGILLLIYFGVSTFKIGI
jgi:hypothetical protein